MVYVGRRGEIGLEVLGHGTAPLRPRPELGAGAAFDWGQPGPGADALALALLADHLGDDRAAIHVYRAVSRSLVAALPPGDWVLGPADIDRAVGAALARRVA